MKKLNFYQLLTLSLTMIMFISLLACNKTSKLANGAKIAENKEFTSNQALKQTFLHNGLDLRIKDGKSVEQHNSETMQMAKMLQQKFERENPEQFLRVKFDFIDGRLVFETQELSKEESKKVANRQRRSRRSVTDCSSDDPAESMDCIVKATKNCAQKGGKPIIDCFNCFIICDESGKVLSEPQPE